MLRKIGAYIVQFLSFVARKILVFDLALTVLIALSFIIWGPFTSTAYSERLIWTGIGVALIAGILVFGQTAGGRDYGLPGQFTRSAHVQNLIDFNIEVRQAIETKMGIFPRIFIIGAILFGLGALVEILF